MSFFNKLDEKDLGAEALYRAITNRFKPFDDTIKVINKLLDLGFGGYETFNIVDSLYDPEKEKFNHLETLNILQEIKDKDNDKDNDKDKAYKIFIESVEGRQEKFNILAFNKILELTKRVSIEQACNLVYLCQNNNEFFIPGCLNELTKLLELGLSIEEIRDILKGTQNDYNADLKTEDFKLTKDIPDFIKKDSKMLVNFIKARSYISSDPNSKFNEKDYNLFNLFAKYMINKDHPTDCISSVEYFSSNKDKKLLNEVLYIASKKGIKQANLSLGLSHSHRELSMDFVNSDIKRAIYIATIFVNSPIGINKDVTSRYLELYELCKQRGVDADEYDEQLAHALIYCYENKELQPKIFKYVKENLGDKNLLFSVKYGRSKEGDSIDLKKLETANRLFEMGIGISNIDKIMLKLYYNGNFSLDELIDIKYSLLEILEQVDAHRNILIPTITNTKNIIDLIFNDVETTTNTVKILGKDNFLKIAKDKFAELSEILELSEVFDSEVNWEPLIKIINPESTTRFKEIELDIAKLKNQFKLKEDNTEIINKIKELSAEKREMLDKKITDSNEAYSTALLYKNISLYNKKCLDEILPYLGSKKADDKQKIKEILNNYLFKLLGVESNNEKIKEIFDFSDSKYIAKLFTADIDFKEGVKELIEILDKNSLSSVSRELNNLPQNIATKEAFKKAQLSYENWVNPLDEVFTTCSIIPKSNKQMHNALKNLELEFNSANYSILPDIEKEALILEMLKKGFSFKSDDTTAYDEDGVFNGHSKVLKIYRNDKPINIDDTVEFLKVFSSLVEKRDFWKKERKDSEIELARITLLDHILKRRSEEIKKARINYNILKSKELVIKKVDMDNIKKSLFLGNDAGCCTATNGCNSWSASSYILNKCIQAIEFKCDNISIGNTMCFIANVNNKLSLILDNIEIKSEYQYSDELRDAIIEFAQKLCTKLGNPNMSIYAGANSHKVNFETFPVIKNCTIKPIGETDGFVYIDCLYGDEEFKGPKFKYADLIKLNN